MSAVKELAAALKNMFPAASFSEKELPSGIVWLDIRHDERFVTIECSPKLGYGVSLVEEGDVGFGGHDRAFGEAAEVIAYVQKLLESPGKDHGNTSASERPPGQDRG